jgi:phosphoribosylaminoimidazole (AIR) synthetase
MMVTRLSRDVINWKEVGKMQVKKITLQEAEELLKTLPVRRTGEYDKLIEQVKKDKQPRVIEGLTHGAAWALYRRCKQEGLQAKVLNKGEKVLILP